jgi:hypothetical protein
LPELTVGEKVRLKLVKEGFDIFDEQVEVKDTGKTPWRFSLPSAKTAWTIETSPVDAVVEVETRAAEGRLMVEVERGKMLPLVVRRPGCDMKSSVLAGTGKSEARTKIELKCADMDGRIDVKGPKKATVRIDGVELPRRAPIADYALPAGQYTVTLVSGKKADSYAIEIQKGESAVVPPKR